MNKTWQVVLAFLVVFVAGGAIGAVFTLRYGPHPVAEATAQPTKPEDFGPQLVRRWMLSNNKLNLTQPQREKIRAIAFDTAEDLRRNTVENAHTAVLLLENMQDEIAAVLNPAQRDHFYQMVQNQREQFTRFTKQLQRRAMEQAQQARAAQGSGGPGE